jgi:hypothetical protein
VRFIVVSRKTNEKFLANFLELDKLCCEKFGVASNGVTEYINRLNNARFAPDRDEVLPRLVKYRNLRNRFAHEPQAIRKCDDIAKADIKWVAKFKKTAKKKKDPISKYLKKARRFARKRKFGRTLLVVLILAALAVAGYFLFF